MQKNLKIIYLSLLGLSSLLALIGGLLCAFSIYNVGLLFLAVAIAFFPVTGHLRMRRSVQTLRTRQLSTSSGSSGNEVFSQLSNLQVSFDKLSHKIQSLQAKNTEANSGNTEGLSRYANELRREARMMRLLLEDERSGKH